MAGWWFGTMDFYDFLFSWDTILSDKLHDFSEGLKPPTRCFCDVMSQNFVLVKSKLAGRMVIPQFLESNFGSIRLDPNWEKDGRNSWDYPKDPEVIR